MDTRAEILLDLVERAELRSLAWGYVDGSLSQEEIVQMARTQHQSGGGGSAAVDWADLIEDLIDAQMLLERQGRLRSRFAETVRLIVRSRQIFRPGQWRSAPRLVADFRVDRRPRLFPHRNVPPDAAWLHMPQEVRDDPLKLAAWRALTRGGEDQPVPLAQFQATSAALLLSPGSSDTATIVTAGTGSGKTYCFYLPVLTEIAAHVAAGSQHTLALALYPRVELLKDQLREAVLLSERLVPLLRQHGARPLRIGVYYGDTPHNWQQLSGPWAPKGWRKAARGYICPYISCPKCKAGMIWTEQDASRGLERLVCAAGLCAGEISNIVLTRDGLKAQGCDLLFITTESLNARMTERQLRPVLGLDRNASKRPLFVLLDEVHTYAGAPGAQVALAMARWRHAVGPSSPGVRWVGLSATLRDAGEFFGVLTGVAASDVRIVSPKAQECFERGCEYQLILRGDPSGQTSLLSTTIQTAMLVGRMTEGRGERTDGLVGRKTFLFTDDLDVNNRLYHSLADAEAYRLRGNRLFPDGQRQPLAALRGEGDDAAERDADGQRWWAVEEIQPGRLSQRLPLGRTTSQDSGVDAAASVVVATASLEVGFNDSTVGFVIQHKAPRGAAGFLQRKGRAGRSQSMRPWMITILSDYGRDRAAFLSYEQLFDPSVPATSLPVNNLYVLRVQATFALLEWLYAQWDEKPTFAYLWNVVAGPKEPPAQRKAIAGILTRLLHGQDTSLRESLSTHLQRSLRIPAERVHLILWQPPRGLMLEVLPTLLRRLAADWRLAFPKAHGSEQLESFARTPLPEFLPQRLFSELQLPEIQILPQDGLEESMSVGSALNMLVPGRVSRRFAPYDSSLSHWVPIDAENASAEMAVEIGGWIAVSEVVQVAGSPLVVVRPRQVRMDIVPPDVLPTSNGRWQWSTAIIASESPTTMDVLRRGPWARIVESWDAHTYSRRAPVRVQRYTERGEANVRRKQGSRITETSLSFALTLHGERAALGLEQDVDGVRLVIRFPSDLSLATRQDWPEDVMASCRMMLLRHQVSHNEHLLALANPFQLDWLAQVFVAAVLVTADANGWDFALACQRVTVSELQDAVAVLFPAVREVSIERGAAFAQDNEDDEDEDEDLQAESPRAEQKLVRTLRALLQDHTVVDALRARSQAAVQATPLEWGAWLRQLLCETTASAMAEAAALVLPRNSTTDALLSDWTWDEVSGSLTLWLTEQSLGGAGIVEELVALCASEPRKLWRAAEAGLAASDAEHASGSMEFFCRYTMDDPVFREAAINCTGTVNHAQRADALDRVAAMLRARGNAVGHAFGVSANVRLLRPGMGPETWNLLAQLCDHRVTLQARLGVLIDLRVFCRIASVHPHLGPAIRAELTRLRGGFPTDEGEAAQILSGILWPQASELRSARKPAWHPYRIVGPVEPGLLRALVEENQHSIVDVAAPDWQEQVVRVLSQHGSVQVSCIDANRAMLSDAIASLATTPIDLGWMQVYAAIERLDASAGLLVATLELRELN